MITMYGIKNCDTIKKARKWLEQEGVEYNFHDYRQDGLPVNQIQQWCKELGWENLLNRRSTSWRQLAEDIRENMDEALALKVIEENPAIIKRPLLDLGQKRLVGFQAKTYAEQFK